MLKTQIKKKNRKKNQKNRKKKYNKIMKISKIIPDKKMSIIFSSKLSVLLLIIEI